MSSHLRVLCGKGSKADCNNKLSIKTIANTAEKCTEHLVYRAAKVVNRAAKVTHSSEKPGEASKNNYKATSDFVEASQLLLTAVKSFTTEPTSRRERLGLAGIV